MNGVTEFSRPLLRFLSWMMIALVTGCGGGGGGGVGGTGTLGVSLTDDAACGFSQVNVTVVKVRVHQSATANENDAGWTDITLSPARKVNLLSLTNGVLMSLGDTPLAAGHYTQLRLVLDANTGSTVVNSVVPSGTSTEIAMSTPSAVQSGIKLINEFNVADGQHVDLALDFNACKSVVPRSGGYALMPVIRVVPFVVNGINGFVATSLFTNNNNVVASAQQNGTVIASTVPKSQTGEFFITRLAPGNYDVVLTADGYATAVISGVPVPSTTSTTVMSTSAVPISLPVSTTRRVNGIVSLDPTSSTIPAYLTARQTLGTGPVVSVKWGAADLLGSNYALTVPAAAPMLGTYSATLPIALVTQPSAAGKYAIEATATGYSTQSVTVDVSAADVTQNFTLVP